MSATPARYVVSVFDRAGEFDTAESSSFAQCLLDVAAMTNAYPGKVVMVSNLDRCDYDASGLTEDEIDAIGEARS